MFGIMLTMTMATLIPMSVERVTEGLISTGIALELSRKCSNVNSFLLGDLRFLFGIKLYFMTLVILNLKLALLSMTFLRKTD